MIDWQASTKPIRDLDTLALLTLLLAACLGTMTVQLESASLLTATRWVAVAMALFQFGATFAGTQLVFKAWRKIRTDLRAVRRQDVQRLRKCVRETAEVVLLNWLLVIAAAALPIALGALLHAPVVGFLFVLLIVFFGAHWINNRRAFRDMAAAFEENRLQPRVSAVQV